MSAQRIASRYASALAELTGEQKKPDEIAGDLQVVKEAVDRSRELRAVLSSPIIPSPKKKAILTEVFGKKIGRLVMQYLLAVVDKNREEFLPEILRQYFVLRDAELGIVRVAVSATVKLTAKQEKELQKKLESITRKKVEAVYSIDRSLKGGFVARIGDTVLDGSIVRQLQVLKRRLKEGSLNN
jgi:F-type H+-transporting ATPase subunit delta